MRQCTGHKEQALLTALYIFSGMRRGDSGEHPETRMYDPDGPEKSPARGLTGSAPTGMLLPRIPFLLIAARTMSARMSRAWRLL
jgi:hypothetical protein